MLNSKVNSSSKSKKIQKHMGDIRFYPEVQIHKKSYVIIEEFTKNWVSLNPFLSQGVTKTTLNCLLSQRWTI
jgi:hypothetical protein